MIAFSILKFFEQILLHTNRFQKILIKIKPIYTYIDISLWAIKCWNIKARLGIQGDKIYPRGRC